MTDGICDLARRNCEAEAVATIDIIDTTDDEDWAPDMSMQREACSAHIGWYRRTFEERGYRVEVTRHE